jgi:long-chain acyl-CoA synthetase
VRPQPGESALTIHELFLSGMATGADRPCLGWRERISTNPVKFASKYEWLSYAEVNERRLNLGSAIEALFRSGRAGGGELPTVGIWCQNRPGAFGLLHTPKHAQTRAPYVS